MRALAAVLVLVLASSNASQYYRPETRLQQEPPWRERYQELPYLAIAFEDDRLLPKLEAGEEGRRWGPPRDPPLLLLNDLDSLESLLQDEANESRAKRTKTSLSIDNPLDVLRQQYYKALARRIKFKSIEKNREHLLKTGKRSGKEGAEGGEFAPAVAQKDLRDSAGSADAGSQGARDTPTQRRYQGGLDALSYQT